eukprot:10647535-Prorocentrum_lima.AAC.1
MYYSLAIEVRTDAQGVCKTNKRSKEKYGCSLKGDRAIPVAIWVAAFPVSYTHLTLPTICSV